MRGAQARAGWMPQWPVPESASGSKSIKDSKQVLRAAPDLHKALMVPDKNPSKGRLLAPNVAFQRTVSFTVGIEGR